MWASVSEGLDACMGQLLRWCWEHSFVPTTENVTHTQPNTSFMQQAERLPKQQPEHDLPEVVAQQPVARILKGVQA